MTNATEAQINYLNDLRKGILAEMDKPFGENVYSIHFGDWMRSEARRIKRETGRSSREVKEELAEKFYHQWVKQVTDRLQIDFTQMNKSDASTMIDELKNPLNILRVEL